MKSVRNKVKSLAFCDGEEDWDGLFGEELCGWSAKFRLELDGQHGVFTGLVTASTSDSESPLEWDNVPEGSKQFVSNLGRFVAVAFRECVHVRLVVEPIDLDMVESEYLAEEAEEEDEEREDEQGSRREGGRDMIEKYRTSTVRRR